MALHLVRVETIEAPSQMATEFYSPLKCDDDGNLYLQNHPEQPAIHKLDPKGKEIGLFRPTSTTDVKVDVGGYFTIAVNGDLYELVAAHEITRYMFVYKSDGTLKSTVKLQPGFTWMPSAIAVFPSGQLLISGLAYDKDLRAAMHPFTGVFSSDGMLLKEVRLEDDETLREMAANGDARVSSPLSSHINRAVSSGRMEWGADGNVYLMRWTSPAIIYAISAGGEVVRRFTIDAGESSFSPTAMHITGNRIAILFMDAQTHEKVMKIVDLEGHEISSYDELPENRSSPKQMLGGAFACYSVNPERFTFLGASDDDRVQFWIAEAR